MDLYHTDRSQPFTTACLDLYNPQALSVDDVDDLYVHDLDDLDGLSVHDLDELSVDYLDCLHDLSEEDLDCLDDLSVDDFDDLSVDDVDDLPVDDVDDLPVDDVDDLSVDDLQYVPPCNSRPCRYPESLKTTFSAYSDSSNNTYFERSTRKVSGTSVVTGGRGG